MSTCLIITQGNKMYIGADSACSVKTPEGFRRYSDDMQKLFQLNEQVFFCSGNMSKVYECVDWIYSHFTHSICIEDLKDYLINNCNEYLNEYYNIEILIADYKTNVVYQLSQYNNFEILTYPYSEQLRIICGGYKTKNAFIMAKKNILLKQPIHNIYHNTYQDIADECVGGYLYLYSSPTDFCKDRITEDNIKYVCQDNELHLLTSEFVTSGFINGTQIIGGDIYSQNYGQSTGTHINLDDGTFSFAGGKLVYDGNDLALEGKITATSGSFTGEVTATTITTSNGTIGKFNLGDALYSGTDSLTSTTKGIYIGTDGIRQYASANSYTTIIGGKISTNNADIKGKISADTFDINGSTISIEKGQDSWTIGKYDEFWQYTQISSLTGGEKFFAFQSDYDVAINNLRVSGYIHLFNDAHIEGNVTINEKLETYRLRTYSIDAHTITAQQISVKGGQVVYSSDNTVTTLQGKSSYLEVAALDSAYAIPWSESDIKLKKNISNSEINALDKINQINFYQFDWKNKESHEELGILANELKDIISNSTIDVTLPEGSEYDSLLNINTYTMLIYALKGIKELIAENEKLYEMINKL